MESRKESGILKGKKKRQDKRRKKKHREKIEGRKGFKSEEKTQ